MYYGESCINTDPSKSKIKNTLYKDENDQEVQQELDELASITIIENFEENEDELLTEAWLFISKEAKDLKKSIKQAVREIYKSDQRKFMDKLKGAFTGANSAVRRKLLAESITKIKSILQTNYMFGPIERTRSYQSGNTTVYETYYVYIFYKLLSNHKLVKIEFEGPTFSFRENKCNIPEEMIKEICSIAGKEDDLYINKKSCFSYKPHSLMKNKSFANDVLAKAEKLGINAKLDIFKSTVKFK